MFHIVIFNGFFTFHKFFAFLFVVVVGHFHSGQNYCYLFFAIQLLKCFYFCAARYQLLLEFLFHFITLIVVLSSAEYPCSPYGCEAHRARSIALRDLNVKLVDVLNVSALLVFKFNNKCHQRQKYVAQ